MFRKPDSSLRSNLLVQTGALTILFVIVAAGCSKSEPVREPREKVVQEMTIPPQSDTPSEEEKEDE